MDSLAVRLLPRGFLVEITETFGRLITEPPVIINVFFGGAPEFNILVCPFPQLAFVGTETDIDFCPISNLPLVINIDIDLESLRCILKSYLVIFLINLQIEGKKE